MSIRGSIRGSIKGSIKGSIERCIEGAIDRSSSLDRSAAGDCPPDQRPRRWWADVPITLVMGAGLITLILVMPDGPASPLSLGAALALALVQSSTVLWIRYRPELAMIIALTAGAGIQANAPHVGWLGFAVVPLSAFSWIRPPRVSIWALAVMVALSPWTLVTGGWRDLLLAILASSLGWAWGELGRTRQIRRREERRRILDAERARIARELHDVIAHTVSVMLVQAGAAADVFDTRPDQARAALDTIQEAGRTALDDLHALLRTMRLEDEGLLPAPVPVSPPQPGIDQLDRLARSLAATGLV